MVSWGSGTGNAYAPLLCIRGNINIAPELL
jgi:hypothetical protein